MIKATVSKAKFILVIEDDIEVSTHMKLFLESEGYLAHNVYSGVEALSYLRTYERKPDLITLDLMMPVMDGWVFRNIQLEDPELKSIPTLVVTASGGDPSSLQTNYIIRKPIDLKKFLTVIEQALNSKEFPSKPRAKVAVCHSLRR